MKKSTGLSRLEIDCGRPAIHPLSEELFELSPQVLPGSAHDIEDFMKAAVEKGDNYTRSCVHANDLMRACVLKFLDVPQLFETETRSCIGVQVSSARRAPSDCYRAAVQYDYRLYGKNCCSLSSYKV
jgi:hypothetical protein